MIFSHMLSQAGFKHGFGTCQTARDEFPENVHVLLQVHGERIVVLSAGRRAEGGGRSGNKNLVFRNLPEEPFRFDEGDAMITDIPGTSIGIRTADCLPVLLADRDSGAVAAVHGGWRSLAAGLAEKVIKALMDLTGSDPSSYTAAMGPSIGPCCYEVGDDVRRSFETSVGGAGPFFKVRRGGIFLDLGGAAKFQLAAAGMLPENIGRVAACTMCDRGLYWSYRAGDETERMISWITAK